MEVQAIERHVRALVGDLPTITMVYLFGSRADAGAQVGPLSDYDFAVLLERGTPADQPAAALRAR